MAIEAKARDYADSGLSIRAAFLDQGRRSPTAKRLDHIFWAGLRVTTGDALPVPEDGIVRGEFLSSKGDIEQGFDMRVEGWLTLRDGTRVKLLRTWNDPRHDPVVEYPFHSRDGKLWVWNVYKMRYPGGQVAEEKWTENAGMWVEGISDRERIYHCSHGAASPPDFESLVFKVSILSG